MQTPRSAPASGSFSIIAAAAVRRTLKVPIRLTLITVSKCSRSWAPRERAMRSAQPIPAQQTEIRSPSGAAAARSTAAATAAGSVTSTGRNSPPISAARSLPRSASRSAITTFAPATASERAVASPRPEAPPVISAPAPSILIARQSNALACSLAGNPTRVGSPYRNRGDGKHQESRRGSRHGSSQGNDRGASRRGSRRTIALIEPVGDELLNRVYSELLSPLAWDLGHIANFEELWLVQTDRRPVAAARGARPVLRRDREPAPRARRAADPPRRRAARLHGRGARADAGGARARSTSAPTPRTRCCAKASSTRCCVAHELQHQETMMQLIQMLDAPYRPAEADPDAFGPAPVEGDGGTVRVEAGTYEIGAPDRGFAYDNERPRHTVELPAFEIDLNPGHQRRVRRVHGGDRGRATDVLGARGRRLGAHRDGHPRAGRPGAARSSTSPGTRPTPSPAGPASGCRPSSSGRRRGRASTASAAPGSGPRRTSSATPASRPSRTRSTRRSSSATPTRCCAAPPGRPTRTSPARASATGICRSGARSSPASASPPTRKGTPDDDRDRRPPDHRRRPRRWRPTCARADPGAEGALAEVLLRRARLAALRGDHRAARSTTRPAASARSWSSARPRSSPPRATRRR